MKNELKKSVVNSQEDEDGFSLNPYEVYIYESANKEEHFNKKKSKMMSGTYVAKLVLISSKERNI